MYNTRKKMTNQDVVSSPERITENCLRTKQILHLLHSYTNITNSNETERQKLVLDDDFRVFTGRLASAGAVVIPFWQLRWITNGARERLNSYLYILSKSNIQHAHIYVSIKLLPWPCFGDLDHFLRS